MDYRIFPPEELIEEGCVRLPRSKSMLNRLMVISALTEGAELPAIADDEALDLKVMHQALEALGEAPSGEQIEVSVGESATALRLLTAFAATRPGLQVILTGTGSLMRRPMGPLVEALRKLGASVEYADREGFAPLRIIGTCVAGGEVRVDASMSSQYVSALMLVAPGMERGLKIEFEGEPSSMPYIRMTARMMERRGIRVEVSPLGVEISPGKYHLADEDIEPDWSAAAFWYEVVALTSGWITLPGLPLPAESLQGDAVAAEYFGCLGVVTEESEDVAGALALSPSPEVFGRLDLDLRDTPDMAPSLAVTAAMLGVPFRFVGLHALGIKETDRLQALVEELDKIGCVVSKIRDFGIEYEGKRHPIVVMPEFDPRGDHRLAMALAPIASYLPGVVVKDVECVAKSYPGFWDELRSLGYTLADPSLPIEADEEEE